MQNDQSPWKTNMKRFRNAVVNTEEKIVNNSDLRAIQESGDYEYNDY